MRFEAFAVSFLPTAGPTLSSTRGAWCKWPEKAIVDKQLQSGQTNGFTTFYKSLWESLPVVFQIGSHQRPTGELCVLVQLTHASDLQATWWDERFQWTIFAYVIYNHIQYTYIIFRNIYIYTHTDTTCMLYMYIYIYIHVHVELFWYQYWLWSIYPLRIQNNLEWYQEFNGFNVIHASCASGLPKSGLHPNEDSFNPKILPGIV